MCQCVNRRPIVTSLLLYSAFCIFASSCFCRTTSLTSTQENIKLTADSWVGKSLSRGISSFNFLTRVWASIIGDAVHGVFWNEFVPFFKRFTEKLHFLFVSNETMLVPYSHHFNSKETLKKSRLKSPLF